MKPQPAAQAMYYAIGFKEEDFKKAQVGGVSMAGMANPMQLCHLNDFVNAE
jgi:dihydroxy-acid dehydratase